MRVGLNATCFDDRPSGANQRFRELYGALIRATPDVDYVLYEPAEHRIGGWFADCANVTIRPTPVPGSGRLVRFAAGRGYWHRTLRDDRLDLFEVFSLPLVRAPCPTLLTIHDLRPLRADRPFAERLVGRPILRHGFANATRVIAVSQAIADEIAVFRPGTPVEVVYNGVDTARFAAGVGAATPSDRFLLAVGHVEARKNLATLVRAVAVLREQGLERPLRIVGNDGGCTPAIRRLTAELGIGDLVQILHDADDTMVRALYAACAMVVVPSAYEGFGIAVIEAMASRRPVVTSDIAVFRELSEGQGRDFALHDPHAAAAAIERVWSDPAETARLVAYGDRRVRHFAFPTLAARLAALHRQVAS
ncbi:glycosyltransferase family 4 protein [Sphingomonas sp. Leaf4]|uniref:glycosyltransferase family 4 protein n=1 Tax=Sphingomonas sp. Leaf4 TaxID=2876553 RepID=UPI001E2BC0F9|nr:glycosyltransferase family 1 protein [Sphingomonas sp. Leaf4]